MRPDPDSPTIVYQAANVIEAGAIVTALEAEGISARMTGAYTSGFQAEAPGQVQVVVRQSQADKARQLIDRVETESKRNRRNDDGA